MKLIDLSAMIEPSPEGVPEFLRTDIAYHSHAEGCGWGGGHTQGPGLPPS